MLARTQTDTRTDRRSAPRASLGRPGTVRTLDGRVVEVTISDLTRDGCAIRSGQIFSPGESVRIGIAGVGLIDAVFVHRTASAYGCAFSNALPPGAVTAAFAPSNVADIPTAYAPQHSPAPVKWSPRARVALLVALPALCWSALGLVAGALWVR